MENERKLKFVDGKYTAEEIEKIISGIRKNAETMIAILRKETGAESFAYDSDTLKLVEKFCDKEKIEREGISGMELVKLRTLVGSFLGECVMERLGGNWRLCDVGRDEWAVAFDEGNVVFPFSKVEKFFTNGSEDSIELMVSGIEILRRNGRGVPDWDFIIATYKTPAEIDFSGKTKSFDAVKAKVLQAIDERKNFRLAAEERFGTFENSLNLLPKVFDGEEKFLLIYSHKSAFDDERSGEYLNVYPINPQESDLEEMLGFFSDFMKGIFPNTKDFEYAWKIAA